MSLAQDMFTVYVVDVFDPMHYASAPCYVRTNMDSASGLCRNPDPIAVSEDWSGGVGMASRLNRGYGFLNRNNNNTNTNDTGSKAKTGPVVPSMPSKTNMPVDSIHQ